MSRIDIPWIMLWNRFFVSKKLPTKGGFQCKEKTLKHYVQKLVPFGSPFKGYDSSTGTNSFSKSFTKVVMECLASDPNQRPTVDQLLSRRFFRRSSGRNDGKHVYNACSADD
ncbi:unnamed protein product [Cuscuta epithymum]|uniref:Protein kinase domain-containing protein n=1 Tax=Cuscuta epithymum TaxID=186058 RepID=A0AAV0D5D2_9ASTE|nr:unnamed protein product [Cuscuta epithymum]